ncbi:hypothetical protein PQ455_12815 [Sphingomonas naphthae]|uniref:Glycerophosphoryl diester phosphodiesterase membrane domain-containing protein n=1 Tax=Sphingomonas naphthae TaxID=1813468 RepID=A0ABY7TH29_9SPHN|nr:hypothetical protein [Sphingomonas naphthae]WCT72513.1 hypothetical protein PQ455_12815 [Sphingomonas naphthae]
MALSPRLSIEQALTAARNFGRSEQWLVVPVTLAFQLVPALLVNLVWPEKLRLDMLSAGAAQIPAGLVLVAFLALLVSVFGGMVLTALAVVPRATVQDAMRLAARRLPAIIGAGLLLFFGWMLAFLIFSIIAGVALAALPVRSLSAALMAIGFIGMLVVIARMAPLLPLMVDRPVGPVAALRATWRLTAGHFWRLLGFLALFFLTTWIVNIAIVTAVGSVLILLGRMMGAVGLAEAVAGLLAATLGAVANAALVLIVAQIYRQLSGASRGI